MTSKDEMKTKMCTPKFHLIVLWMITTLPMSQILFKNKK